MTVPSGNMLDQANKQAPTQTFVWLLEINNSLLSAPIRITDNNENVVYNAHTFVPFGFIGLKPDELENQSSRVVLSVDNVDQSFITALSDIPEDVETTVSLIEVVAEDPNNNVNGPYDMILEDTDFDENVVNLTCIFKTSFEDSYPAHDFNPGDDAGLFNS